ncbi:hypothetical protein GGX14DRAFT_578732 [Mycena pura]|uniref:Uncharacterized protein n=1 Tax=Mycena pura TaxID=153505 RepID=A0AAD6UPC2_9AGAR|nr:hypothetical protein GGX14DRAFT_578732 [Mycena pura]
MSSTTHCETNRLFGPVNRPALNTNVRHRAFLRKSIELFSQEELEAIFGWPHHLRIAMGTAYTASQFGKIRSNYVYNDRLVRRESPVPSAQAQQELIHYRDRFDAYYKKRGNGYAVRDPKAKQALQAAEQAWHDWVIGYHAARGRSGRPDWALEALPGLERVRVDRVRRASKKRKFLGVIDISSDEEQDVRPSKKTRFLGMIDLTA